MNLVRSLLALLAIAFSTLAVSVRADISAPAAEFNRPPHIIAAVDFWRRIYAEIDTRHGVIHDNREHGWIYELYPLDAGKTPRRQQRDISRRVQHYRQLLRSMAETESASFNAEQRRIFNLLGEPVDTSVFLAAAKRLRFQRGQADRFRAGMQRQAKVAQVVNSILAEHGLPPELAALPHVESSYNPKVRSSAGAVGLWQIMPATGRRYLRVSKQLDERTDLNASTNAAAKLLKHNYAVLQSWPLAITAYNRGLAGVRRAVKASGTRDIGEITRNYEGRAFGFASRNFYAEFLAAHDVSSGAYPVTANGESSYRLTIQRYLPIFAVEKKFGLSRMALKSVNPSLGIQHWNGELDLSPGYQLGLPSAAFGSLDVAAELRSLETDQGSDRQQPPRFYRIQKGDLLKNIAERHSLPAKQLMRINGVRSASRIVAGRILQVSDAGKNLSAPSRRAVAASQDPRPREIADTALRSRNQVVSRIQQTARGVMLVGIKPAPGLEASIKQYAFAAMQLQPAFPWRAGNETMARLRLPQIPLALLTSEAQALAIAEAQQAEAVASVTESAISLVGLQADPADYLVGQDDQIEIQSGETLGQYASWLELDTKQLAQLNDLRSRRKLVVGKRLLLAFDNVSRSEFERRRHEFHSRIQQQYFSEHRIAGLHTHSLSGGDSLWELAQTEYYIPFWLLRQYNPELDLASVLPLNHQLTIPLVTSKTPSV